MRGKKPSLQKRTFRSLLGVRIGASAFSSFFLSSADSFPSFFIASNRSSIFEWSSIFFPPISFRLHHPNTLSVSIIDLPTEHRHPFPPHASWLQQSFACYWRINELRWLRQDRSMLFLHEPWTQKASVKCQGLSQTRFSWVLSLPCPPNSGAHSEEQE